MECLKRHLKDRAVFADATIGWHCHLTRLTAAAVDVLIDAGARVHLSECNPETTDVDAVNYMEAQGARVYRGADGVHRVLSQRPDAISDTGLVLTSAYLVGEHFALAGACEITTSGITKLRSLSGMSLPVVNINDGQIKTLIENFHGVGDGLVDALRRLDSRMWAGRPVAVVGYGRVGAGVGFYLRRIGALVHVVETDPVRKLVAHYDGFALTALAEALARCELVVTATGRAGLIGNKEWSAARHRLIVLNVGHWAAEVSPSALREIALSSHKVKPHLEGFRLPDESGGSKVVYLASGGSPVNVAMLTGSPEPTLIHLTTEVLTLEYLLRSKRRASPLPAGEHPIPPEVERAAAELALEALGSG